MPGLDIQVLGGGPAGLYFALLARQREPAHRVTVLERDARDETFGWGIVLSERTLGFLKEQDAPSWAAIVAASETWERVDTVHRGERVSVRGQGFSGIARLALLEILQRRCLDLGVDLRFGTPVADPRALGGADLLVGADGASSVVRQAWSAAFLPSVDLRQNRYIWLGTPRRFEALTMVFRESEAGLFIAHAYRFRPDLSTFIVECPPETWARSGLESLDLAAGCRYLEAVFREDLGGAPLLARPAARWINFPLVRNKRWGHGRVVLVGDAAHTAHFSIGSGTRLALEDAAALAGALAEHREAAAALAAYERQRKPRVDAFQAAAYRSLTWLENVQAHLHLPALAFTHRLMTRSRRVSQAALRARDPAFVDAWEAWRASARRDAGPLPAEFLDLFERPAHAHLATLMPDGTPHVTPVWVDWDGRHILVNSARGRQKDLNMSRRPEVALEIADPDDPNRYLHVRGRVVEITEEGADQHLDRLARRYLGRDTYPAAWRFPGEVRRIYRIAPRKVTAWNPFG